jgi:two-component system, OmpR family, sensor histidine kinase CiaH
MHSAEGIEDRLFTPARIRLTVWYTGVLTAVLIVLGTAIYLAVREQLLNGVDNGVHQVAQRATEQWQANGQVDQYGLSTGPYTVTLMTPDRTLTLTKNGHYHVDPASLSAALRDGSDMRYAGKSGDRQRVYSVRVGQPGNMALIQVERSVEPEHEALSKLLAGLLIGGAAGIVLAAIGGWFLAGKSLAPVRVAFDRQHAFVSDASHELRTPLAVIRANAEFIQQEQPDNTEARDIVGETDRLSSLVDALLAVARGQKHANGSMTDVDLGELIERTVASFEPLAAEHGLELSSATADDLAVQGDREQLQQVILILLDNAVRYTAEGGRVHVQARRDGGNAIITVHDTGIGIGEEELERVFERFYRADEARNRQSGGAGLGLAIARELVMRHGGRISVESTEGAGSTFTIQLPAG